MTRKPRAKKAYSTDVLDYPAAMSLYEIESLAAEARLAEKKAKLQKTKPPGVAKRKK